MADPKRLATPVKHDRDFARLDFRTEIDVFMPIGVHGNRARPSISTASIERLTGQRTAPSAQRHAADAMFLKLCGNLQHDGGVA